MKLSIEEIFKDLEKQVYGLDEQTVTNTETTTTKDNVAVDEVEQEQEVKEITANDVEQESEEEAENPDIIADMNEQTSEDIHGGNENAHEVENSKTQQGDKNSEPQNESKESEVVSATTNLQAKNSISGSKEKKSSNPSNTHEGNREDGSNYHSETSQYTFNDQNSSLYTRHEETVQKIQEMYNDAQKQFKQLPLQEQLNTKMLTLIKKIAMQNYGTTHQKGNEMYDASKIAKHLITGERYKIINDKYEKKDSKYVMLFIDTSGSNYVAFESLKNTMQLLSMQGFTCVVADCSNGFSRKDMDDDEYHAKSKMESFTCAKMAKVIRPCAQTAAKMVQNAEFSIILADFDGLSSICEMASMCHSKERIPYFLSTEHRYSWQERTQHSWVNPKCCDYPDESRIYDLGEIVYDIEKEQERMREVDGREY